MDSPFLFLMRFFSSFLQAYIFPVARTWHAQTYGAKKTQWENLKAHLFVILLHVILIYVHYVNKEDWEQKYNKPVCINQYIKR